MQAAGQRRRAPNPRYVEKDAVEHFTDSDTDASPTQKRRKTHTVAADTAEQPLSNDRDTSESEYGSDDDDGHISSEDQGYDDCEEEEEQEEVAEGAAVQDDLCRWVEAQATAGSSTNCNNMHLSHTDTALSLSLASPLCQHTHRPFEKAHLKQIVSAARGRLSASTLKGYDTMINVFNVSSGLVQSSR